MEMVSSNAVVGLSRGEHASEVARMLSEALRAGRVDNVVVVPTEPLGEGVRGVWIGDANDR